jgi:tRNA U55 pseudouridine synthase TruB
MTTREMTRADDERDLLALELRRKGYPSRRIAQKTGHSSGTYVRALVSRINRDTRMAEGGEC